VIINDLDLESVASFPSKTDPPLVIDANTVLARAIAFELLQAIAGRDAEVFELLGSVDNAELPQHEAVELGGKVIALGGARS
jgi:hypothetical protein